MTDIEQLYNDIVQWFAVVFVALVLIYVLVQSASTLIPDVSGLPAILMGSLVTIFVLGVYLKIRREMKSWR